MIIRDYLEEDNIKIFDRDIVESHADYNAQGLGNLYAQEEKYFGSLVEKNIFFKL